jgi:ubiquinone/menaquinone biosynthesis C-methylase UbiE
LNARVAKDPDLDVKRRTAASFDYEWRRFDTPPQTMEDNFWGYFQFFSPEFFAGKRVLEIGPGMGRHTFHLARWAREVVAADLGPAIEVTRKNTAGCGNVRYLRADIFALPFPPESFDFVCAIGVLPCVPDPESALREMLRFVRPGGHVHVYVYWALEHAPAWQRALLRLVNSTRRVTVRLPFRLLDAVAFVAAVAGYTVFSLPYRYLSRWRSGRRLAQSLPLQRYAKDGFRVCYNDQFDRLSAPIEHRHRRAEVVGWLERAGLEDIRVEPHWGWIASGRKPDR